MRRLKEFFFNMLVVLIFFIVTIIIPTACVSAVISVIGMW